jgi:hypothetical protein
MSTDDDDLVFLIRKAMVRWPEFFEVPVPLTRWQRLRFFLHCIFDGRRCVPDFWRGRYER